MGSQTRNGTIFVVLSLILIATLTVAIFITQRKTGEIISNLAMDRMIASNEGLVVYIDELAERAKIRAALLANRKRFVDAVKDRNMHVIKEFLLEFSEGFDFLSVCDTNGVLIVRSDNDVSDIDISSLNNIAAALGRGVEASSILFMPDGNLGVGASIRIIDSSGFVGILSCVTNISDNRHLDAFKERSGSEASIFVGHTRVATTLIDDDGNRMVGTKADESVVRALFERKEPYCFAILNITGRQLGSYYTPIVQRGEIIGMLATFASIQQALESRSMLRYWIIYTAVFGIVLSVICILASQKFSRMFRELSIKTVKFENMEKLLESMDAMIVIAEVESDKVIFVNDSMKRAIGFTNDVLGRNCWEILTKDATERCSFCPKNSMNKLSNESVTWEFHNPINNRYYRITSRFIDWPDGNRVFIEQSDDITELREQILKAQDAEERLSLIIERMRETDEYTQMLFDAMPMCCLLWDEDGELINCNREALRLFEMEDKEELRARFSELSPEYQPCGRRSDEMRMQWINKALKDGYLRIEWMHKLLNGEIIPAEITFMRMKHGDVYVVATYSRDLREHKAHLAEISRAQEQMRRARDVAEAANRAKSAFLANMSHEIRTPMNSIIGFSELALDGDNPPKTKEYLGKISESAEWLLVIINDILDISKIESGRMELEHIPFDLHDIFMHCRAVILPKAEEKGLTLYCYAEPSIGKKMLGDPIRLRQALLNILSNAVKFTNVGTIKLLASIKELTDSHVVVHFEVKDSGIGMNADQVARVFEPFMQADNSITRKFGGTGLGLTITKNILELMGGNLEVESVPGVGSKFCFELTFDVIDAEEAETVARNMMFYDLERPNFEGEALVCEDNAMNQQVICEHLDRVGIKTVIAQNGREAVDLVAARRDKGQKPFDLIFMDIHMPIMDGLEAASKISEMGVKTPIVAMTANIMSNELELYKVNGMSDSLGKPFTSQELWQCLMKYFTLVSVSEIDFTKQTEEREKMQRHLKLNFIKSCRNTFADIVAAINEGDIKLAHRLVHTLKGNAGQIGETRLQDTAAAAEAALKDGVNNFTDELRTALETDLNNTLKKLEPLLTEAELSYKTGVPSAERINQLFDMLQGMLASRNPECMNLIGEIKTIPGAEELARLIEDFEFKSAAEELARIR